MPALGVALGVPFYQSAAFGDPFGRFLDSCGGIVSMASESTDRPILEGRSLSFDGATQYGFFDDNSSLNGKLGAVTISALVNKSTPPSTSGTIISSGSHDYRVWHNGSTGFVTINSTGATGYSLPSDQWVLVEVDFNSDAEGTELRVNGVVEWTGTAQAGDTGGESEIVIGGRNNGTSTGVFFEGQISNVKITGDTNEHWDLYNNGLSAIGGNDLTLVGNPPVVIGNTIPYDPANERGYTDDNGTIYLARADNPAIDVAGNPTQYQGSVYPVLPKPMQSNALEFDGATQYGDTGVSSIGWSSVDIEVDIKTTEAVGFKMFVGSDDGLGNRLYMSLNDGNLSAGVGLENIAQIDSGHFIADGLPHKVKLSVNGSLVKLFADGVEVLSQAQNGSIANALSIFTGGYNNSGTLGFATACTLSNLKITGDTELHYPLAEGEGDMCYDTSGNGNHGTLVGNPTWIQSDDVRPSNLVDGFSLYEHATLDPIRVPYGDDGQPLVITPPTGYTKTTDNPFVEDGHNDAETQLNFYNVATNGGTTPAVVASGVVLTDYSFGDPLTNPMFKRELTSVAEDRHTLFGEVLTGTCLEKANKFFESDADVFDDEFDEEFG